MIDRSKEVLVSANLKSLVLTASDAEVARVRWLRLLAGYSYPNAFARRFVLRMHQRDYPRFVDMVARAKAQAEDGVREVARELVARKLLPESRASPPQVGMVVNDRRGEATRTWYPLPRFE